MVPWASESASVRSLPAISMMALPKPVSVTGRSTEIFPFVLLNVKLPSPEIVAVVPITPLRVTLPLLDISKLEIRAELIVIPLVPVMAPTEPPFPTCSLPELTVVAPVYVFAPARTNVPAPDFTRLPLPLITPLRVTVLASATSKITLPPAMVVVPV